MGYTEDGQPITEYKSRSEAFAQFCREYKLPEEQLSFYLWAWGEGYKRGWEKGYYDGLQTARERK